MGIELVMNNGNLDGVGIRLINQILYLLRIIDRRPPVDDFNMTPKTNSPQV
jgi:hypothetical protein